MTNSVAEVDPIVMGQGFAPLNSTFPNKSLSTSNGGTAGRAVLTVAAAATITLDKTARSILFVPSVAPTGPIFIKWGTQAGQTTASATVFDEVITATYPAVQLGIAPFCTSYSIYSGTSQTVYTIER